MINKILILLVIMFLIFWIKEVHSDYNGVLKLPKVHLAVTVWDKNVKEMQDLWYSKTRILDLLAIQSIECNLENWNCKSKSDCWPFQINQIHRKEYNLCKRLLKEERYSELYTIQLKFTNDLIESAESSSCSQYSFNKIKRERTTEERVKCIWRFYNWSKTKKTYWEILYKKREMIKVYYNNFWKIWV